MQEYPMFGPEDLRAARKEGYADGQRNEIARSKRWTHFFITLGVLAAILALVFVVWLIATKAPTPKYDWVEIGGRQCVQVENPDYSATNKIDKSQNLVFCERQ